MKHKILRGKEQMHPSNMKSRVSMKKSGFIS